MNTKRSERSMLYSFGKPGIAVLTECLLAVNKVKINQ
jgi:hypothetical protein